MKFNYYYGSQAEQFSFVRIPRIMLTDKSFQSLSMAAKVLYTEQKAHSQSAELIFVVDQVP